MSDGDESDGDDGRWTDTRIRAVKLVVGGLVQITAIAAITLMELAAIQHGENGQYLIPFAGMVGWLSGINQDKLLDMILPK
jgi:hypothetical protein